MTIWPRKHKRKTPSQDQGKSTALGKFEILRNGALLNTHTYGRETKMKPMLAQTIWGYEEIEQHHVLLLYFVGLQHIESFHHCVACTL